MNRCVTVFGVLAVICCGLLGFSQAAHAQTGTGVLRGVIRWDKGLRRPKEDQPFVFSAIVQTGSPRTGVFGPPTATITRPVSGRVTETATGYEMRYEVRDLPDIEMSGSSFSLAKNVEWSGFTKPLLDLGRLKPQQIPLKLTYVQPNGWEGSLRILQKKMQIMPIKHSTGKNPIGFLVLENINYTLVALDKPKPLN